MASYAKNFLLIAISIWTSAAFAQDSLNVSCVYQTDFGFSTVTAVAVRDTFAYVAAGVELHVFDIHDPATTWDCGFCSPSDFENYCVALQDSHAYLANEGGLSVTNISNPFEPVEVGFLHTPGYAYGVAIRGAYAYMADDFDGLRIVNISDPTLPREEGSCDIPNDIEAVCVAGNYAYVGGDYGLSIVDIETPSAPVLRGLFQINAFAFGVAVIGNYAYVAFGLGGLRIIDVSNPVAPAQVGSLDMPDQTSAWAVSVLGDYAYVAYGDGSFDGVGGLYVVNVSNPASPVLAGFHSTQGSPFAVTAAGPYAYLVGNNGFAIYDCSAAIGLSALPPFIPQPSSLTLSAYPNPFNPSTRIRLAAPQSGRYELAVYDITGRLVQSLADRVYHTGSYTLSFNGSALPSGMYFVRLQGATSSVTSKIVLLK